MHSFGALRLARLDMSHNGMTSIAEGAFDTLHETLNELDLGYNDFQRFADVFLDFRMLQYLGLAHNRLGKAFAAGREQLGHLFDTLQLLQVLYSHGATHVVALKATFCSLLSHTIVQSVG